MSDRCLSCGRFYEPEDYITPRFAVCPCEKAANKTKKKKRDNVGPLEGCEYTDCHDCAFAAFCGYTEDGSAEEEMKNAKIDKSTGYTIKCSTKPSSKKFQVVLSKLIPKQKRHMKWRY